MGDSSPEERASDTILQALSAGLEELVVLPITGFTPQRFRPNAAYISAEIRNDPAKYRSALTELFPPRANGSTKVEHTRGVRAPGEVRRRIRLRDWRVGPLRPRR